MKKSINKKFICIIFHLICTYGISQPVESINVYFVPFDSSSKEIPFAKFCENYKLICHRFADCDCEPIYEKDEKDYLTVTESTVSNNWWKIIHENDTMNLWFVPETWNETFVIDTLCFMPGYFAISNSYTNKLNEFEAKSEYYNNLIPLIKRKQRAMIHDKNALKLFQQLQNEYGIAKEDKTRKSAYEIMSKVNILTADDIVRMDMRFIVGYYEWVSDENLKNTSHSEELILYNDSTFFYNLTCPNLDHSNSFSSDGTYLIKGKKILLNSYKKPVQHNRLIFEDQVWVNFNNNLKPRSINNDRDFFCGMNKLKRKILKETIIPIKLK